MSSEAIEVLKDKLINAKDLSDVMDYFLTHLGEDPEFLSLGKRIQHPVLEVLLPQIGKQMLGKRAKMKHLELMRVPEHHLVHGGFTLGGKIGNLIYFEDIHLGLLAVAVSFRTGETKFARFSDQRVPTPKDPSQN